ncbi:unnamed protein product [Caretta caretta]
MRCKMEGQKTLKSTVLHQCEALGKEEPDREEGLWQPGLPAAEYPEDLEGPDCSPAQRESNTEGGWGWPVAEYPEDPELPAAEYPEEMEDPELPAAEYPEEMEDPELPAVEYLEEMEDPELPAAEYPEEMEGP